MDRAWPFNVKAEKNMKKLESLKITTIVDNDSWKGGLRSSWGLSFYVETCTDDRRFNVLMDTSGSFQTFLHNSSELGLDLTAVEAVLISHWHGDHCGALDQVLSLLRPHTPVYVPSANSYGIRMIRNASGDPFVCSEPYELAEGLMSTGEISRGISEHSLVANVKDKGLVVLTGCSHPGIVNIVTRARKASGENSVYVVMGGFHISSRNEGARVGKFLKEIDVAITSPCHCTGQEARKEMMKALGKKYVRNGSGKTITIGQLRRLQS